MKFSLNFNKICLIFFIVLCIFLFSNVVQSPNLFKSWRTCFDTWGESCDSVTLDDAFNTTSYCNGTVYCDNDDCNNWPYVSNVSINATNFFPESAINITCVFNGKNLGGGWKHYHYIWYYNTSDWINIQNWTTIETHTVLNRSAVFQVNSTEGTHIVRCILSYNVTTPSGDGSIPTECANTTYSNYYDNDDVNFTITNYPSYDSWNLTNVTGALVPYNVSLTRFDELNASTHWNIDIYNATVRHNGTGSFNNYTVSSSYTGNWTNYTLDLSNTTDFNETGLIEVSYIWANSTHYLENTTSPNLYFYLWGNSEVDEIYFNQTSVYNKTTVQTFCRILDSNLSQTIYNYNVSFYKNDSYIGSGLTNSTGWANNTHNFNTSDLPSNFTVKCNITDSSSLYFNATSVDSNETTLQVLSSSQLFIDNFWFDYLDTRTNETNRWTTLNISANVSDNIEMDSVWANVSYPGGVIDASLSMSGNTSSGWQTWNCSFNNSYPLNITGDYNISITIRNLNGVVNTSTYNITLTVNDTYTINRTSEYTTYMRGENVTLQALDVLDNIISSVNWTVNVTKIDLASNYSAEQRTFNYTVAGNDTDGNYTLLVINATKDGNYGNLSFDFNVSSVLNVSISASVSSPTTLSTSITVNVSIYNPRSTLYNSTFSANISCHNSSLLYDMSPLPFSSSNASFICYSPSSYSTNYNITVNITDIYNNTGTGIHNLTTTSAPSTDGTTTDGGGGGGGAGTTIIEANCTVTTKNCTDGIDNDCDGLTDCGDPDCSRDEACQIEIKELNFTLSASSIEIEQGEDGTIIGSLFNMGNTRLTLNTSVENECCNISLPQGFVLPVKGETDFSIVIHVPLFENVGEYLVRIELYTGVLTKEKAFKIVVKKSSHIITLESLERRLSELKSTIDEYQVVGLSVGGLTKNIDESTEDIDIARDAIKNDDLTALQNYISSLEEKINSMSSSLPSLEIQKLLLDYKWYIAGVLMTVIMTSYITTQIIIPYHRLGLDIKKLTEEEMSLVGSRKAAEKQYFMRKIDEKTFFKIMVGKQGEVLKARATVDQKKQLRANLVKERLHPVAMLRWVNRGLIKIKSSPGKIYDKLKSKFKKQEVT